ncbi:hypothetical protein OF83DRAFT_854172 [Amylostereum chailletii]|nr:hypothetical protein OF83DRAFT_854172 [Amylostereum chailletii]
MLYTPLSSGLRLSAALLYPIDSNFNAFFRSQASRTYAFGGPRRLYTCSYGPERTPAILPTAGNLAAEDTHWDRVTLPGVRKCLCYLSWTYARAHYPILFFRHLQLRGRHVTSFSVSSGGGRGNSLLTIRLWIAHAFVACPPVPAQPCCSRSLPQDLRPQRSAFLDRRRWTGADGNVFRPGCHRGSIAPPFPPAIVPHRPHI